MFSCSASQPISVKIKAFFGDLSVCGGLQSVRCSDRELVWLFVDVTHKDGEEVAIGSSADTDTLRAARAPASGCQTRSGNRYAEETSTHTHALCALWTLCRVHYHPYETELHDAPHGDETGDFLSCPYTDLCWTGK